MTAASGRAGQPHITKSTASCSSAAVDDITLYWLTGTTASSACFYWENHTPAPPPPTVVDIPAGVSVFPGEIIRTPCIWAEHRLFRGRLEFQGA